MRVLRLLFILLLSSCCRNVGVYHTYYGDIDVDTLEAYRDGEGYSSYIVKTTKLDSAQSKAMGLEEMYQIIFYTPQTGKYSIQMVGSDGGYSAQMPYEPLNNEKFE